MGYIGKIFKKDSLFHKSESFFDKDDIYRAWLLVGNAILELDLIPGDEVPQLVSKVNYYIAEPSDDAKRTAEMLRAERAMGIPIPAKRLNPKNVHSEAELKSLKKKVYQLATFTALCVLYLALEKSSFLTSNSCRGYSLMSMSLWLRLKVTAQ